MRFALSALILIAATSGAYAAKNTRFWNLTENTITSLQLAPTGTDKWGENQTKNDKDNAVDHDERLKIIGASDGNYDVRFSDDKGRTCVVKNISIKEGDVFSIEEKQLTGCLKK
ncbi:MAG: hypothetical protein P4L76_04715 [Beijerinckiaceae bacterium]|nr:hypothetical protein [Beijerinckiaceae bacterium]